MHVTIICYRKDGSEIMHRPFEPETTNQLQAHVTYHHKTTGAERTIAIRETSDGPRTVGYIGEPVSRDQ